MPFLLLLSLLSVLQIVSLDLDPTTIINSLNRPVGSTSERSLNARFSPLFAPFLLRNSPLHAPLTLHRFPVIPLVAPLLLTRFSTCSARAFAPLTCCVHFLLAKSTFTQEESLSPVCYLSDCSVTKTQYRKASTIVSFFSLRPNQ